MKADDKTVTMEGDLHIQLEAPTFDRGRDTLLRIVESLFRLGYSVTLTDGPRVVERPPHNPRRGS